MYVTLLTSPRGGGGYSLLWTLQSDNGDIHENVVKLKIDSASRAFLDYPKSSSYLKEGNLLLELKRGGHPRVQKEMVEFIALPLPSSKKLKVWPFEVVVVQGRQRNVQKSVMQEQSCCFAY